MRLRVWFCKRGAFLRWLGGGDEDAGGLSGAGLGVVANDDFDVAAEAAEEVHEALYGETIEAVAGEG